MLHVKPAGQGDAALEQHDKNGKGPENTQRYNAMEGPVT